MRYSHHQPTQPRTLHTRGFNTRGFTLIEVIIVFVLMAMLAYILVINLQGSARRGDDTLAASSLDHVTLVEQSYAASRGRYTSWPPSLALTEDIRAVTGPSTGPEAVSIAVGESGSLGVAVRSDGNNICYGRYLSSPQSDTVEASDVFEIADSRDCSGASALQGPDGTRQDAAVNPQSTA